MARDLANCVVVITGASSGIGRAAARRFALEGSSLVLAARAEGPLRDAAEECERLGVLINLSSVWGRVTAPDVSAYVASKFAVRALGECLRQELRNVPDVDVATILPQAVDTPIFARAANYSGRSVRPIPPLLDPEEVADGIVLCAQSPKREVTYARMLPPAFEAGNYGNERVAPKDGGVLRGESAPHGQRDGWRTDRRGELRLALLATLRGSARGLRGRRL